MEFTRLRSLLAQYITFTRKTCVPAVPFLSYFPLVKIEKNSTAQYGTHVDRVNTMY